MHTLYVSTFIIIHLTYIYLDEVSWDLPREESTSVWNDCSKPLQVPTIHCSFVVPAAARWPNVRTNEMADSTNNSMAIVCYR